MRVEMAVGTLLPVAVIFLLGGCGVPRQYQKQDAEGGQSSVHPRSANAFAELEAAERGEPILPPAEPEKPRASQPEPAVEKPYKPKPFASVEVNPSRAAPPWTTGQPVMPGFYLGIGVSVSHGNEEDDWARSRNHAYTELASNLKVHISSAIKDYFKENNLRFYEKDNLIKDSARQDSSYAEDTSFFVDQTLEGVEIHDRWKDDDQNKFWILVRLSKEEIERRIRERLDQARKKAVDYVEAAVQAQQAGRVGEAFKGYFNAYLALREYFGGVVQFDMNGDGKPEVINHEIERSVHRLASDLEWQVNDPNLKAVIGGGIGTPLAVNVSYQGKPVRSLPVAFAFQRGTGSVEMNISTGENGLATARVMKVFGNKQAILGARVDVEALVGEKRLASVVEAKFGKDVDLKTGKFFVELEELSAYLQIQEENLGNEVQPGTISADIKEILNKALGVVFTNSAKGADMEIRGEAVTGDCTDFYDKRMCTARVNLTVVDRLHDRQLFSKKYKVKGTGDGDEEAGRDALRKAGPRIAKEIIEGMK